MKLQRISSVGLGLERVSRAGNIPPLRYTRLALRRCNKAGSVAQQDAAVSVPELAKRPGLGGAGKPISVLTNHFPLMVSKDPNLKFFQYSFSAIAGKWW